MMLKKITFLLIAFLALNAKAQFTIDEDTLYAYGFAGTSSSSFVDIYAHTVIRNTGPQPEKILWNRMTPTLPDVNWTTGICDILSCRGPEVSSDSFSFNAAGDTGILSFHFYCKNISGQGWMTVRFSRAFNPLQYVDVVINAIAWNPVGIRNIATSITGVYPNPASKAVRIENQSFGSATLKVINVQGQVIMELPFDKSLDLDILSLSSGVYTILIEGEEGFSTSKFIKE